VKIVERAAELESLQSALDGCAAGRSGVVLVEGPVGCGKSELISEAIDRATVRGHVVLRATGAAAERRLPLGLLGQLAASGPPGLLPPRRERGRRGLRESMELFGAAVRRLAANGPVAICVDDWQHADDLSRAHLLHLAQGSRHAGILLVLARALPTPAPDPLLESELLRLPRLVRLRAGRLSPSGVDALLDEAGIGAEAHRRLAHRLAGGNPLLLRAVVEDVTGPGAPRPAGDADGPQAGAAYGIRADGAYGHALFTCLARAGGDARAVARAVAVLDGHASGQAVAALLDRPAGDVARTLETLTAAALLDGARFRHPVARAAVLGTTPAAERGPLYRRAAAVVRQDGAPAEAVAERLVAAWDASEPWAVPVLQSAAAHLLAAGAPQRALDCLRLAGEALTEPQRRADNSLRGAEAAARIDPEDAELRLAAVLEEARAGRLDPANLGTLAGLLTGHGRLDEAREVRDLAGGADTSAGTGAGGRADTDDGVGAGGPVLTVPDAMPSFAVYPGCPAPPEYLSPPWYDGAGRPAGAAAGAAVDGHAPPRREGARGAAACAGHWRLDERPPAAAVGAAEAHLRSARGGCSAIEPVLYALRALLYLGGPARALPWCTEFAEQAERRGAPGWAALVRTVHAEALLRQGDLTGAETAARAALALVPRSAGSTTVTGTVGVLVQALLARGRADTAAAELARPLAESGHATVPGLSYLRARGRFHLAAGRYHAALGDFLEIGRRMRRWGLDRPVVLPWRTDAAEALLGLGETRQAERFVTQQLALPDATDAWVQGITLRRRAALQDPRRRKTLLDRSAEALRRSGDRYELARTLAEFGRALQECGETARAAMVHRTAWHLADECGARPLRDTVESAGPAPVAAPPPAPATTASSSELAERLTDSERRVAALAVRGDTNREIAGKLFITVSTVEQHLTRAYRKLGVTSRQQLPVELQLLVTDA
jgi:DNA-binding CsgD family transcriptional regulator